MRGTKILIGSNIEIRLETPFVLERDKDGFYTLRNNNNIESIFLGDFDEMIELLKTVMKAGKEITKTFGK